MATDWRADVIHQLLSQSDSLLYSDAKIPPSYQENILQAMCQGNITWWVNIGQAEHNRNWLDDTSAFDLEKNCYFVRLSNYVLFPGTWIRLD